MVSAELIYNPYLLETDVLFDGKPPRINSMVEKYKNEKLQTWISKVPSVFYDEMNGYYFELDFSGTELDFQELEKSFKQAGVGKDLVQLFHKGELGSRMEKLLAIDGLLKWLEKNPNRKFDFESFYEKHRNLFDETYPYVVIGGAVNSENLFEGITVSVDNVESVDELRKTDLHSTPVLFYLDRKSVGTLQHNLLALLKRKDITQDQLFFLINPAIRAQVIRIIQDLGVKNPQLVESANDKNVYRYLELFPVSEYIYDAVRVFEEEAGRQRDILTEENRQSELVNKDIHEQINGLDDILSRLKTANDYFAAKENMDIPSDLVNAKFDLINSINQWRKKKTKITRTDEAAVAAYDFEAELKRLFDAFQKNVAQIYSRESVSLFACCDNWYRSAQYKEEFVTEEINVPDLTETDAPDIASELMKIKDEQYVTPKEDFFGMLFKNPQENVSREPVLETIFFCEKWRAYAVDAVEPVAEKLVKEAYTSLCEYYDQLTALYMRQIETLIQEVTAEKEKVSSQLSADERLLQADNDWHTIFCDKLHEIERS